ncbi:MULTISPECIES: YIP1 family protein [unclassified Rhodosalinus]|uniref:YIP1 family protein n=1 Tax=unclassified Rhodosalinus TaxID=2630183 RepID=UPI0035247240
MTTAALWQLALDTIRDPREAGRRILAMEVPSDALWMALALAVVLNAGLFGLSNELAPPPPDVPVGTVSPVAFALFLFTGVLATVFAVYRVGRALGGEASFHGTMALLVWLQFLRVLVQAALLVLVPLVPVLAAIVVIAAAVIGFWILLNFIDVAHGYDNIFKSLGVLVLSVLAMAFGLSLLLALFGGSFLGVSGNV